jgi:hypothetical protein
MAVLIIAALATWNVHFAQNESDLSDINLANIEALATEDTNVITCYNSGFVLT